MAALPPADDPWNMDQFLEDQLDVDNQDMKDYLQDSGFLNMS